MDLALEDITLKFPHKTVLQNLCVRFSGGQLHALLGQNGAGKSTTANIICGELKPDSGKILLDGESVAFKTPRDAIAKEICYVHQRPMLADSISVKENLLLGLNKEQKERLLLEAQKWLPGVELNTLVKNYGADTRFFIALTSALIKTPQILILDEPSALLNEEQEEFLFENLHQLASNGMNIIIITHNFEEAKKYCDTIDFIEEGQIIEKNELKQKGHIDPFDKLRDRKIDLRDRKIDLRDLGGNFNTNGNSTSQETIPFTYNNYSFEITKGQITLIKGLAEDGMEELEKELIALRQAVPEFVKGQGPRLFHDKKIGLIPTDRKFTGSNPNLTIQQMLTAALDIPENQKPAAAKKMIEASGVNITALEKCSNLSGGMLQKLMFEREFYGAPEFLILCNPLQGLDVQTCERSYKRIMQAAQNGAYVLVLSYGAFPSEYSDKEYRISKGKLEEVSCTTLV